MYKTANGSSVARGFVLALLLLGVSGGQALAHRSPSNCNANRLTLSLDQNPAGNIVSGQTVTYTVGVFNPGPGTGIGCDVTGTTVTLTCPGADGTPSGSTTVLGTGLSFPADNSGDTIFPSVSCKVVVNPGVTSATARAQGGQNTGNRTADLTKGVLHDAAVDDPFVRINDLTVSVNTCVAKVDKQVSCDGGKTFHDVGLVSADEDGHTDVCFGWNAFTIGGTSMPAEAIQVRYAVANAGTADLLTCSITEGNAGFPTTVSVGSLAGACVADVDCGNAQATCVNGACVFTSGANQADCSATLSAAEPDKATVTCDCTPTPGEVQATAFDEAKFQCLTPGLAVTKACKVQAADGTSEVDVTLMNTGTADLQNCVVTDKVFPNDPTCPPTTTTSTDVTVAGVASLPAGQSTTVMGSVTGLTTNACNTVAVTCEIKDSVDPANPSQPKKTPPATDQDVCPVASVSISKVCAAQDASGVNQITFTVTNTGGVALANCAITDNIFENDMTCPPTHTGTPVPTTPATIASLDPKATASATGSVSGLTKDACDDVVVTCDVVGATGRTVTSKDEKVCAARPPCPTNCANPRIGGGAQPPICTVLELDGGSVSITGPAGGIDGDICIADGGKLAITGSQFVTSNIRLSSGASFSKSGSGRTGQVQNNQNLSQQVTDALNRAALDAALPCTQTIGTLSGGETIVGNGGLNVICVGRVTIGGKVVTLTGGTSDQFVLNITGKFALTGGGQIRVAGGVQPGAVEYNIIGTGEQVAFSGGGGGTGCCKAIVDGTLLAPARNIALSPGLVNGQVISGRNISIVSVASVRCKCPTP